jgi:hypothetical protein
MERITEGCTDCGGASPLSFTFTIQSTIVDTSKSKTGDDQSKGIPKFRVCH